MYTAGVHFTIILGNRPSKPLVLGFVDDKNLSDICSALVLESCVLPFYTSSHKNRLQATEGHTK